jgi:hypothetical protein
MTDQDSETNKNPNFEIKSVPATDLIQAKIENGPGFRSRRGPQPAVPLSP